MPKLEEQIEIAAPAERVFDYLADTERGPEWMPNLVEAQRTSRRARGRGAETAVLFKVGRQGSRGTSRCLEWDRPRRLVVESSLDIGVTSTIAFELAKDGAGTRLSAMVDYSLPGKGLGRFVGGLFGNAIAGRDVRMALTNVKQRLESETPRRTSRGR